LFSNIKVNNLTDKENNDDVCLPSVFFLGSVLCSAPRGLVTRTDTGWPVVEKKIIIIIIIIIFIIIVIVIIIIVIVIIIVVVVIIIIVIIIIAVVVAIIIIIIMNDGRRRCSLALACLSNVMFTQPLVHVQRFV
jgi:hypothetical protein